MLALDADMATEAAVAAAVEPDEMDDVWSGWMCCGGGCWFAYMRFAASVASGEGWPYGVGD